MINSPIRRSRRGRASLLAGAVLTACSSVCSATTSNWLYGVDGNWTDASKWSTSPDYPNNGVPAGTSYDAVIEAPGNYTVSLASPIAVDSLRLNAAGATAAHSAGTLSLTNGLLLQAGTYYLSGGGITGGTIASTGGTLLVKGTANATLDGVTLDLSPTFQTAAFNTPTLRFINGLTLSNRTINLGPGSSDNDIRFDGTQTVGGTGEFRFEANGYYNTNYLSMVNGTTTFGPGITIRTLGNASAYIGRGASFNPLNGSWINQGLIHCESPDSSLELTATWSNQGVLRLTAGRLNLGGSFRPSDIGNFQRSGGTLRLTGTVNNSNNAWTIDSSLGTVELQGGEIVGGIVRSSGTGKLTTASSSSGLLNGVTLDTDMTVSAITLRNGFTLLNNRKLTSNGYSTGADLWFGGSQTITGNGSIVLNNDYVYLRNYPDINPMAITIDPGVTICNSTSGYGGIEAHYLTDATLTNKGTILAQAPGQIFELDTQWTNQGVLRVTAGYLLLGGSFKTSDIGTVDHVGGEVVISGSVDNTNSNLQVNNATGSWLLAKNSYIQGGTLSASGSATWSTTYYTGEFDEPAQLSGVVVDADLTVSGGALRLVNGTTFTPGRTLKLYTDLLTGHRYSPSSAQGISGDVTISFEGGGVIYPDVGTLDIGQNVTIKTGAASGGIGVSSPYIGATTINNYGLISAQTLGKTIFFGASQAGSQYRNFGVMEAINGGNLQIQANAVNQGTVQARSGGMVIINGSQNPSIISNGVLMGGVWAVYSGSTIKLNNATIATNAASVILSGTGSSFTALNSLQSNSGSLALLAGRDFQVLGSLNNSGLLTIGAGSDLAVGSNLQLNSGSKLRMELGGTGNEQFGQMTAVLAASLTGELEIQLSAGYLPNAYDRFRILSASSRTGYFSSIVQPPLPPGQWFDVLYDGGNVDVQLLPEPAVAPLLALGLARRRRRPCAH